MKRNYRINITLLRKLPGDSEKFPVRKIVYVHEGYILKIEGVTDVQNLKKCSLTSHGKIYFKLSFYSGDR